MKKTLVTAVSIMFLLLSFKTVKAENLKMRPYLYTQDFEAETNLGQMQASGDGICTINFIGLTQEKSFSGKKCFKLDVTFHGGSYYFWSIPIPGVPVEGKLQFSGHILLGEETAEGVTAGLGLHYTFPPTTQLASSAFTAISAKGEWKSIEGDAVKAGPGLKLWLMGRPAWPWPATEKNIGVYTKELGLLLFGGGEGKRVVVYVDDLKLEGTVPTEEAYQEAIKKRWFPVNEKLTEKISSWEETLQESEKELNSLNNLSPEAKKLKEAVLKEGIASFKANVAKVKKIGFMNFVEEKEIDSFLEPLKNTINNIKTISKSTTQSKDMIVYIIKPTENIKILPTTSILPGAISQDIKIITAPGEYEPASFVISALTDLNSVKLKTSDLKGTGGIIPSENIDIKVVKCWYQGGAGVGNEPLRGKTVLVPELLLNDDALVKVNYQEEKNYLKVVHSRGTSSEKEEYVWISDPTGPVLKDDTVDLPVQDSPVLLPTDIPSGTNKQFWITVKVPDTTKAGVYTGSIVLTSGTKTLPALTLTLTVLPFKLSSPKTCYDLREDFVSSIYYHSYLNPTLPEGSLSAYDKNKEQLKAELNDLFIHGVTNPQCNQGFSETLLGEYLKIRNEVGMGGQPLFILNWCPGTVRDTSAPAVIKQTIAFAKPYGIPEVYFYGADEAVGEKLKAQRPAWEATRKAGGKIFVSGSSTNFELMGDIQDLLVAVGPPVPEEAAKWHSVGHKIWCYFNPQGGIENPDIYRRNFGLMLWKANYDGAATFSYQANAGNSWNDLDDPGQRDFMMAYPTVNGVIDTIQWEGYREGQDDIRYATTLKLEIEKARKSVDVGLKETALSAEKWLSQLDVNNDLDTIRLEMINYILKLRKEIPAAL